MGCRTIYCCALHLHSNGRFYHGLCHGRTPLLAKYVVLCVDNNLTGSHGVEGAAHTCCPGSVSFLATFGVHVSSCLSSLSRTRPISRRQTIYILHRSSISLAALVYTIALPMLVADSQWYTHIESVFMCKLFVCHWRAKMKPSIAASS